MKHTLTAAILALCMHPIAQAQTEPSAVTKTTVVIEDKSCPGLTISFNASGNDVEDVLKEEIKRNDGKSRSSSGFIVGRGITIKQFSEKEQDIYWKLKSKGRKKKEIVTVTMAVRNPDGSCLSDAQYNDSYTSTYAWLSALPHKVDVYKKDQELEALRKQLKKVTNDLKDLQGNTSDQRRAYGRKSKELKELEEKIDKLQKQNR